MFFRCFTYSGTSPLGHLYLGHTEFGPGKVFILIFDSNPTSIQGTPILVPKVSLGGSTVFQKSRAINLKPSFSFLLRHKAHITYRRGALSGDANGVSLPMCVTIFFLNVVMCRRLYQKFAQEVTSSKGYVWPVVE